MLQDKFTRLDDMAAPSSYVVPPTSEDLAYVVYFRKVCQRYNIDFATTDQDERDFVIRMAEKGFLPQRA